jgi:hypothetical protein
MKKRRRSQASLRGSGALDRILDEGKIFGVPIPELHLRGFSGKYNFAGPGTRLYERLDAYGRPLPHSQPINEIDRIALQHDLDYEYGMNKKEADQKMITALDRMKPRNWRERADRFLVRSAIKGKLLLGLGKKKAKAKRKQASKSASASARKKVLKIKPKKRRLYKRF